MIQDFSQDDDQFGSWEIGDFHFGIPGIFDLNRLNKNNLNGDEGRNYPCHIIMLGIDIHVIFRICMLLYIEINVCIFWKQQSEK